MKAREKLRRRHAEEKRKCKGNGNITIWKRDRNATQFISMQTRNYKRPPESKNKWINEPGTRERRRIYDPGKDGREGDGSGVIKERERMGSIG